MWCQHVDQRKDGTTCARVFLRHNGKQSCLTFDDHAIAPRFEDLIGKVGADRAMEIAHIERKERAAPNSPYLTGYATTSSISPVSRSAPAPNTT